MADYDKLFTWKEEGFAELQQQFRELAKGLALDKAVRDTLVKASKRAMEPVFNSVVQTAPYDAKNPRNENRPIHLRDTVKLYARIPNDSDQESVYASPTDITIAIVSVKKSAVSLANEFGTAKMAAQPFLRPALAKNAGAVIDTLRDELENIIPAYASRLAKRNARKK